MSAYLKSLRQAVLEAPPQENRADDLKVRVHEWFEGLPAFTRQRPYSIREVEVALKRPGRLLSPALLALGWRRKRRWNSREHYHRYWLPPATHPIEADGPTAIS